MSLTTDGSQYPILLPPSKITKYSKLPGRGGVHIYALYFKFLYMHLHALAISWNRIHLQSKHFCPKHYFIVKLTNFGAILHALLSRVAS